MDAFTVLFDGAKGAASLAPLATFGVALVAYFAYRQKTKADKRDQWWKRAQWAIDASLDQEDPQRRLTGVSVLVHMVDSDLATAGDADLMKILSIAIQDEELEEEFEDEEGGSGVDDPQDISQT
ncbi:hypothetical protein ACIQH5_17080 [Paenarthrobacter sp. NPDC091711]|uniref:hypothetical protein n=1 Tax=Paenarthrobacter sp. NPDC091711 TaxID=3364385 RepID=UPI0038170B8E